MASASETIDADDFMKEFNFLQGKEEPNSNDVLAKVLSLSGINESDISSHRQDILAEAVCIHWSEKAFSGQNFCFRTQMVIIMVRIS